MITEKDIKEIYKLINLYRPEEKDELERLLFDRTNDFFMEVLHKVKQRGESDEKVNTCSNLHSIYYRVRDHARRLL